MPLKTTKLAHTQHRLNGQNFLEPPPPPPKRTRILVLIELNISYDVITNRNLIPWYSSSPPWQCFSASSLKTMPQNTTEDKYVKA